MNENVEQRTTGDEIDPYQLDDLTTEGDETDETTREADDVYEGDPPKEERGLSQEELAAAIEAAEARAEEVGWRNFKRACECVGLPTYAADDGKVINHKHDDATLYQSMRGRPDLYMLKRISRELAALWPRIEDESVSRSQLAYDVEAIAFRAKTTVELVKRATR